MPMLSDLLEEAASLAGVAHGTGSIHLNQDGVFIAVEENGAHIEGDS